jgi:anti-anti-sigma regulatory factor
MPLIDEQPDRCIYPRPFAEDFADCPAYQATTFIAADSRNQPLGEWRTCRHLTAGNQLENRGRFYPRCALGSRSQRLQWVAQVSPARVDVVRALQDEFDGFSMPHRRQLSEARTRLHAGSRSRATEAETQELIDGFLQAIDRFLTANEARFQDVGLPTQPLRQLIREWVIAWVRTPEMATPRLTDAPPDAFANPVRAFVGLPIEPAAEWSRRLWDRPIYSDTILQILPTMDPPGIALVGDVESSNVQAVARALAGLPAVAVDLHLDLSGLLFCDLGGLQAIVRAAQALEPGRRLVLRGIPRQLERALEIVDWAPLPNLSIASAAPGMERAAYQS